VVAVGPAGRMRRADREHLDHELHGRCRAARVEVRRCHRRRADGAAPGGTQAFVTFRVDERVLKPCAAGFLAVGGSFTSQWKTLTLPLMDMATFSMHMAVVGQVQFKGASTPRSSVLDQAALDQAAELGHHVIGQLGVPFPGHELTTRSAGGTAT
jgi:hypothetical protein